MRILVVALLCMYFETSEASSMFTVETRLTKIEHELNYELLQAVTSGSIPARVEALYSEAQLLVTERNCDDARDILVTALSSIHMKAGVHSRHQIPILQQLARCQALSADMRALEKTLKFWLFIETKQSRSTESTMLIYRLLGDYYAAQERWMEALWTYEDALAQFRSFGQNSHRDLIYLEHKADQAAHFMFLSDSLDS